MTKRSFGRFERSPRDHYDTPAAAVAPLLPYLAAGTEFAEPCAGRGALIDALEAAGHKCVWATDLEPQRDGIGRLDAMTLMDIGKRNLRVGAIITNPPWTRSVMHPIIEGLSRLWPCWFLFDADWAYTGQATDLLWKCARIIPVGRVKWIPGSKHVGFDNASWYEFLPGHAAGPHFIPPGSAPPEAMMGPEERRRHEIKLAGKVSEPGPLFRVVAPKPASAAAAVPSEMMSAASGLLAKLRARAGKVGPIPKMTPEVIGAVDKAEGRGSAE